MTGASGEGSRSLVYTGKKRGKILYYPAKRLPNSLKILRIEIVIYKEMFLVNYEIVLTT